jgi:hypothetical protein
MKFENNKYVVRGGCFCMRRKNKVMLNWRGIKREEQRKIIDDSSKVRTNWSQSQRYGAAFLHFLYHCLLHGDRRHRFEKQKIKFIIFSPSDLIFSPMMCG